MIPGTVLIGERVQLREVRPADVTDDYLRWMNDAEVMKYLEARFLSHSLESLRAYAAAMAEHPDNVFLAIRLKQHDRHVGNIKLGPISWVHKSADVGLLIGEKDCWGKGLATEAIGLVTRYAFGALKLRRLSAGCYSTNVGSARAFVKAGWRQEGRRRSQFSSEGAYVDEILLGVTAEDVAPLA